MGLRSAHGHRLATLKRTPPPPLRHKLVCPGCNRRFLACGVTLSIAPPLAECAGTGIDWRRRKSDGRRPNGFDARAQTDRHCAATIEGGDPVAPGLVTNLHPGGNITGVSFYTSPFVTKRLDHGTKGHKRGRQLA